MARVFCRICQKLVPVGVDSCPQDGADAKSWVPANLEFSSGSAKCRVRAFPFLMDRGWMRAHFESVRDEWGNPLYKYLSPEVPILKVFSEPSGYRFLSDVAGDEFTNHMRLDGKPLDKSGGVLGDAGGLLELWSHSRKKVVASMRIGFCP